GGLAIVGRFWTDSRRRVDCWKRRLEVDDRDVRNEAVAAPGHCFDESGTLGGIAQRLADLVDRFVEAVVEIHERIRRPEATLEFRARHEIARPGQERGKHLKRLLLEPNPDATLLQF